MVALLVVLFITSCLIIDSVHLHFSTQESKIYKTAHLIEKTI